MPERSRSGFFHVHIASGCPTVLALTLAWGLFLAGCASFSQETAATSAPDVPAQWEVASGQTTVVATDLAQWWQWFSDPALTGIMDEALSANADIAVARGAWQQARATRDFAAAALSPTLNGSASAKSDVNGEGVGSDAIQVGVTAAWDFDLFGAKKYALDASEASLLAARARLGGVQGAVAAAVALNFIVLRSTQARLDIGRANLSSQLETLQIARWRNEAGLVDALDVEQAIVAAQQTQAQLLPLEAGVESLLHKLAVQSGKSSAALVDLRNGAPGPLPMAPVPLNLDSPTDALRHRPDLAVQQYLVAKAQADVDQAQARRYPSLSAGATLGVGAATVSALSRASSAVASVLLGLTGVLLDGGAGEAQVRVQQAALVQARAGYRSVVLNALAEMEDAMSALRADTQRLAHLQQVVDSANRAALMARQRYASGLIDFQIVLETQRSQLAIQDSVAQADANVSSDQVRLFNALGGGWRPDESTRTVATPQTP